MQKSKKHALLPVILYYYFKLFPSIQTFYTSLSSTIVLKTHIDAIFWNQFKLLNANEWSFCYLK